MLELGPIVHNRLTEWMGQDTDQIDDITLLGIEIKDPK